MVLDGNNQAKCPVCDKTVTWTAISEISGSYLELIGDTHYYLANDITWDGTDTAIQYNWSSTYARKTACLHLNGHNLTATKAIAIFTGNYLNIMGNGIVKGNRNTSGRAVTLEANSSVALLNVYGGTYQRYDKTNTMDLFRMNNNCTGGSVNIYQGAILGDPVRDTSTKGNTATVMSGILNVYGGELHGEYNGAVVQLGSYISGSTAISGTLNVFGGLLQAKNGSGVAVNGQEAKHTAFNIYGGKVMGGTALGVYCDMTIGGTAFMNRLVVSAGAKITLAEMAEGASITLQGTGVFTKQSNNAAAYLKYFHPLSGYNAPTVVDNALSMTKVS